MTRDKISYQHGNSGTKPSGLDFQNGVSPSPDHYNWWWYELITTVNGVWNEFDRLDSDDDGVVDKTDSTPTADKLDGQPPDKLSANPIEISDSATSTSSSQVTSTTTFDRYLVPTRVYIETSSAGASADWEVHLVGKPSTTVFSGTSATTEIHGVTNEVIQNDQPYSAVELYATDIDLSVTVRAVETGERV